MYWVGILLVGGGLLLCFFFGVVVVEFVGVGFGSFCCVDVWWLGWFVGSVVVYF